MYRNGRGARAKQEWAIGATVKVGFLTLRVVGKIATPGDYRPDMWQLESDRGVRYEFTPHFGLERVS